MRTHNTKQNQRIAGMAVLHALVLVVLICAMVNGAVAGAAEADVCVGEGGWWRAGGVDGGGLRDTLLPYHSSGNIANGGDYLPLVTQSASISGRVCGEDGVTPIEGATVKAGAWDIMPFEFVCESTTDANGIYVITNLSAGDHRVYAYSPEYGREFYNGTHFREDAQPVSVIGGGETPNINFSLGPGGNISGTITSADSGMPLSNVSLFAAFADVKRGAGAGLSDENGNYTIIGLPYSTYKVLSPSHARFGSGDGNYIMEFWQENATWDDAGIVTVAEGMNPAGIDFTLDVGGSLSGTVLDQHTGEPVDDASCGSIDLGAGWHKFVYRHQENDGGQTCRAAFKAPGDTEWRWFSTSELEVNTSLGQDAESGIMLTNKKNIWEHHPENHGELVACVDRDSTEEGDWYGCSIVDAVNQNENIHGNDDYYTSYYEGYFCVDAAGTWQFSTDSDDASEIVIDDQVVAYWYQGHGSANRWWHKMEVRLHWYDTNKWVASTSGNADGNYTFGNLPPGSYRVEATAPGYVTEFFEESVGRDDAIPVVVTASNETQCIDFTMEVGGTISGYVYQEDGVTPLLDVHVYAEDFDTEEWMAGTDTDQYGFYPLVLPNGTYRVRACPSENGINYVGRWYNDTHNRDEATAVSVTAPDETAGINFALEVGGTISGYVYEVDGVTPLPDVHVYAVDYDTDGWMDGTDTDQYGFYSLVLPNGTYRVRANPSGNGLNYVSGWYNATYDWDEATAVSVTAPDETTGINFTLELGGTISGTVRDSQGNLLAGVSVDCSRIDGPGGEGAETESDGTYTIEGLPFGTYKVSSPSDGRWGPNDDNWAQEWYYEATNWNDADDVAITSDNPNATGVDFTMEVGGTISGYVYGVDGVTPLPDVHVYAGDFDTDEWMDGTDTDQYGFYSLVLPNGTYRVRANPSGNGLNYVSEWYNATYDWDDATAVSVTAPDDTSGINFTLELGGTISGYVYEADGVTPLSNVHVYAVDYDTDEWMDGTDTDQDGFYSLVLPNGTYRVCTCGFCCSELPYAGECYDAPVPVTVPNDTSNINFTLVSIVRRATIEEAVADGVAWLAAEQNPDGSWGSQYQIAKTALAVLNLETHATELNYSSPFNSTYNYSDEIESGLNYLFSHAQIINISSQTHGGRVDNPDTNGNGTGIYFRSPDLPPDHGCVDIYETSIAMMGIAASTDPARVVNVTGSAVDGWTYEDVLQDAVDYLAWAQTDSGFGRGGWNYEPMDNSGDRSDQSNSGWVTLGLAYAEAPSSGFELTIPGFVRSELDIWIDYIRNDVDGDANDGGSDYTGPDDPDWDGAWVNVLKTGNLLQQMAFVGDTATTQRAQDAINYTVRHWNDDNGDPGWGGCPTCYHATYTTMKGLEALNVTTIDSIDWFQDFTDALLSEQTIDGWWMVSCFDDGEGILSTEWALLTLQKRIPRITKPDLTVLEKHEEWMDEGTGTYRVFYTVKNRGNMEALAGHNVSLTVDGVAIEQKTVPVSLDPAATYSGSFDMVLSVGQEYHEIVVCADSTGMVDELNEDNNCLINIWPYRVHNLNTGENFSTIQEAIDASNTTAGHTITVDPETYNENVVVSKQVTIRSTTGNPADTIVNAINSYDHVFEVTADYVNISGFTVTGATESRNAGILLVGASCCNISENNASDNWYGISLDKSNNNTLTNNTANSNNDHGILLKNSSYCNVENNTANNNRGFEGEEDGPPPSTGIIILGSHNIIRQNDASNNFIGIAVLSGGPTGDVVSANNTIEGNTASNNTMESFQGETLPPCGIILGGTDDNTLTNNIANSNTRHGILLKNSSYCNVENNTANENSYGILLVSSCNYNTLTNNTANSNTMRGILLKNSSYCNVENNTANNNRGFEGEEDGLSPSIGIAILGSHNTIRQNDASNNFIGIVVTSRGSTGYIVSANNTIEGNTANSNTRSHGIWLWESCDNAVTDNTANLNNEGGICLDYSSNNTITGNTANENNHSGIQLLQESCNNTVTNNTANENNDSGVCLEDSSDHNTLSDNTANSNNWNHGIYLDSSSSNLLTNNICSDNDYGSGIQLSSSSDDNTLENNIANGNCVGISLDSSSNNTLVNNTANSNALDSGIRLHYSSDNTLSDNTANGNNDYGIELRHSNSNTLTSNTASLNDDDGIRLNSSSDNNITCNLVQNNTDRAFSLCGGSTNNNISFNNIIENGNHNDTTGGYEWQFENEQNDDVDAINNWWGTTDNGTINASIYDWNDNSERGNVTYLPRLRQPAPCAPAPISEEPPAFTTADAVIALEIAAGSRPFNSRWDVSGDGQVTSLDALMILQKAAKKTHLRIGYLPSTHQLAEMVAMEKGWWVEDLAKFGIAEVTDQQFPSGPPEMQSMMAGNLDVAYVGVTPLITAIAEGLDAKIVAAVQTNGSDLVLIPEINYSPSNLSGLTIATFPPGSVMDIVLKSFLTDNNVSNVTIVPMGPKDAIEAIGNGSVNGVFLPHPSPAIIELDGNGRSVVSSGEMWTDHACCCLVVSGKLIRDHPDLVREIVRTHIKATEYVNENQNESAKIFANKTGYDLDTVNYSIRHWDGKWISDPHIELECTIEFANISYDRGYINRPLTAEDLFDTSFYDE